MNQIQELKSKIEAENIYLQDEIKLDHNFEKITILNRKACDVEQLRY